MAHDVFISHSSSDKPVADAACAALESAGIRCWIAPRDVQPGRSFAGEITRAIQQSKAMVLIFSADSNNSEQVLREVQLAVNARLHIVQFRIEDVLPNDDLEYYLSTPHWLDALNPPLDKNLDRLAAAINALLVSPEEQKAVSATVSSAPVVSPKPPGIAPGASREQTRGRRLRWIASAVAIVSVAAAVFFVIGIKRRPANKSVPTLLQIGLSYRLREHKLVADRYGYIDERGRTVIEPQWEDTNGFRWDGVARVRKSGKWGYIDTTGKVVTKLQWDEEYWFSEELAGVREADKWGFIDKSGKVLIEPQWDEVHDFNEGFAGVKRGEKWGVIDKSGRVTVEPKWERVESFHHGLALVQGANLEFGYIDPTGRIAIELQKDLGDYFFEDLASARQGDKYGFIDRTGRFVIPARWHSVRHFSEGLAAVQEANPQGKWGFVNKSGTVTIKPEWSDVDTFYDGVARVRAVDEKFGYIDQTGHIISEPKWDRGRWFDNGLCGVERKGKVGFIDKSDQIVVPLEWDDADSFYNGGGEVTRVKRNSKWGLIDRAGHVIIKPEWDVLESYPANKKTYWIAGQQAAGTVVAVWFDPTGKRIWSSDDAVIQ
jgi:TIR domain-containing protein/WG repeat protein